MPPEEHGQKLSRFITLATFILAIAILRLAQPVLVPMALAGLLAFLLSPIVIALTRAGLGKKASVVLTSALAFSLIAGVGWIVTTQVVGLMHDLPNYQRNLDAKVARLQMPKTPEAFRAAAELAATLEGKLNARERSEVLHGTPDGRSPVPVEIEPVRHSTVEILENLAAPILGPLATAGIVVVFVIAILLQRDDLRDRFIRVVSAGKINVATQAINDAAGRVSRYLGMQLTINACYGVCIGVGLGFIGIPDALLWGLLATLLRFIPFIGPWLGAALPLLLSIAIDPGWTRVGETLALYVAAELITVNLFETWLYGTSTGVSSLALMVAAVFWTWLWGVAGLFLSTPLTVCVMVIGKYVPGLKFLSVLLGSDPVLPASAQFYNRMLSMDSEQMLDLALKWVAERSLAEFYDSIFIPALVLAKEDRHDGALAEGRQKFIFQHSRELIEELERRQETPPGAAKIAHSMTILGVPARDEADELAALMLRHLLRDRGWRVDVSAVTDLPASAAARIASEGVRIAFISALPPSALGAARQMTRRLRESSPGLRVVAGVWTHEITVSELRERMRNVRPDEVSTSLQEAVREIEKFAAEGDGAAASMNRTSSPIGGAAAASLPPVSPDPQPAAESPPSLAEVPIDDVYDVTLRHFAQIFDVPLSLTTIVDADGPFWHRPASDTNSPFDSTDGRWRTFIADHCATDLDLLIVDDVSKDPRFAKHSFLMERGVRFYAYLSLRDRDGHSVGSLCVVDSKPRTIGGPHRADLHARCRALMQAVEARLAEGASEFRAVALT